MTSNRWLIRVEWGDCDPAGIVFYPNYFRWFDAATAALFESAGLPLPQLYREHGLKGFPLLEAKASFSGSSAFGDALECESDIADWAQKTFTVRHRLRRQGALLVEGSELRVCAIPHPDDPARIKAAPIPAIVRERLGGGGGTP
ncbi:MAG TPA: acyl-CoA thioesterase [Stellaceae bacterium]|jgi:4-hydroxybenzoyl-CoA thioesterase|nr:acyl-CoA thioesterase [Stellaceae bacterium]